MSGVSPPHFSFSLLALLVMDKFHRPAAQSRCLQDISAYLCEALAALPKAPVAEAFCREHRRVQRQFVLVSFLFRNFFFFSCLLIKYEIFIYVSVCFDPRM
jgi:hypothetical protein